MSNTLPDVILTKNIQDIYNNENIQDTSCASSENSVDNLRIDKVFSLGDDFSNEISFIDIEKIDIEEHELSFPKVDNFPENSVNENLPESPSNENETQVSMLFNNETEQLCYKCFTPIKCKFMVNRGSNIFYICGDKCLTQFFASSRIKFSSKVINIHNITNGSNSSENDSSNNLDDSFKNLIRKCVECYRALGDPRYNSGLISWENMEFCDEECIEQYQSKNCSICRACRKEIPKMVIGKYSTKLGPVFNHFCSNVCLNQLRFLTKVCQYCREDISKLTKTYTAIFKYLYYEFCSSDCLAKYNIFTNRINKNIVEFGKCSICKSEKQLTVTLERNDLIVKFCDNRCFFVYKELNKIDALKCENCLNFSSKKIKQFSIFLNSTVKHFCSRVCRNIFIEKIKKVDHCYWCKAAKYNFDMLSKIINNQEVKMCSLHCLQLYQISLTTAKRENACSSCQRILESKFHITGTDAKIKNFCSKECVDCFLKKMPRPITIINTVQPNILSRSQLPGTSNQNINIRPNLNVQHPNILPRTNVLGNQSRPNFIPNMNFASQLRPIVPNTVNQTHTPNVINVVEKQTSSSNPQKNSVVINQKFKLIHPQNLNTLNKNATTNQIVYFERNPEDPTSNITRQIMVTPRPRPKMVNKSIACRPIQVNRAVSTDLKLSNKKTQTDNFVNLLPIPAPIYVPTPVFVGQKPVPFPVLIPVPVPVPVFLPMKKDSAKEIIQEIKRIKDIIPNDPLEAEMVQIAGSLEQKQINASLEDFERFEVALKDGGVDELQPGTSKDLKSKKKNRNKENNKCSKERLRESKNIKVNKVDIIKKNVKSDFEKIYDTNYRLERKRKPKNDIEKNTTKHETPRLKRSKRLCKNETVTTEEKKDKSLQTTLGVNAWKMWFEDKYGGTPSKYKDILELTTEELNYNLICFVKEIRKPNGQEYYPDTVYYLCLCIQKYLFDNGKTFNIFVDDSYKNFIDTLDEVTSVFSALHLDEQVVITRVEEEHLWESKQLGVYSPKILLITLIYFNTINFQLDTAEKHMDLSFGRVVKNYKRSNQNSTSLRYYPPDSANSDKTFYEMFENSENSYRCPVKLYDFYVSKCPINVRKNMNNFYLVPEKYCVPDSPVWFSNEPVSKRDLEIILKRLNMVKEVNIETYK